MAVGQILSTPVPAGAPPLPADFAFVHAADLAVEVFVVIVDVTGDFVFDAGVRAGGVCIIAGKQAETRIDECSIASCRVVRSAQQINVERSVGIAESSQRQLIARPSDRNTIQIRLIRRHHRLDVGRFLKCEHQSLS